MKILTVAAVPPNPNSGASGTVVKINEGLRSLGHEVDEIWDDELTHRIKHGNLYSLLEQPRTYRTAIQRRLENSQYDVIDINQPQGWLAAKFLRQRNFSGAIVNRSHGVELLVNAVVPKWHKTLGVAESTFPRSLLTPVLRKFLESQWPAAATYSDGIIVSSELDRNYLIQKLKLEDDKVVAIQQGIPDNILETTPAPMTGGRIKRLLYVGQFSFIKGPHLLAQIFTDVLRAHPETEVTWVTAEDAHATIRELVDTEVHNRLNLVSWMPQDELIQTYQSHGIFVFPSFFEGFGKAPFEAMAAGVCAVCSDAGGMRDIIDDEKSGYLCAVGDTQTFVNRIERLLSDITEAKEMSVRSRKAVEHLTWNRCAAETAEFYHAILDRKQSAHRVVANSVT